jgi:hypothetical protein
MMLSSLENHLKVSSFELLYPMKKTKHVLFRNETKMEKIMEDSRILYNMLRTLCKVEHFTEIGNQHTQYNSLYRILSEIFILMRIHLLVSFD